MAVFSVIRDRYSYQENEYVDALKENVVKLCTGDNIAYYNAYGVDAENIDSVAEEFLVVQNAYGKAFGNSSHGFEIKITEDMKYEDVCLLADKLVNWIGEMFQCVGTVFLNGDEYDLKFLVNSVSYRTGEKFCDCNQRYIGIMEKIEEMTGFSITVKVEDECLF